MLSMQPDQLATICGFGDAQDQTMCINGAIERLADYKPEVAQTACHLLTGEQAATCWAATRNKMYGLGKDFSLYYR